MLANTPQISLKFHLNIGTLSMPWPRGCSEAEVLLSMHTRASKLEGCTHLTNWRGCYTIQEVLTSYLM